MIVTIQVLRTNIARCLFIFEINMRNGACGFSFWKWFGNRIDIGIHKFIIKIFPILLYTIHHNFFFHYIHVFSPFQAFNNMLQHVNAASFFANSDVSIQMIS